MAPVDSARIGRCSLFTCSSPSRVMERSLSHRAHRHVMGILYSTLQRPRGDDGDQYSARTEVPRALGRGPQRASSQFFVWFRCLLACKERSWLHPLFSWLDRHRRGHCRHAADHRRLRCDDLRPVRPGPANHQRGRVQRLLHEGRVVEALEAYWAPCSADRAPWPCSCSGTISTWHSDRLCGPAGMLVCSSDGCPLIRVPRILGQSRHGDGWWVAGMRDTCRSGRRLASLVSCPNSGTTTGGVASNSAGRPGAVSDLGDWIKTDLISDG